MTRVPTVRRLPGRAIDQHPTPTSGAGIVVHPPGPQEGPTFLAASLVAPADPPGPQEGPTFLAASLAHREWGETQLVGPVGR